MFSHKSGMEVGSPLLRNAEGSGPSLFSSALRSKYMSPVKLSNLPQVEKTKDRGKQLGHSLQVISEECINLLIMH